MTTTSTGVIRVRNGVRSAHDTEEAEMSEREELLQGNSDSQPLFSTAHPGSGTSFSCTEAA